MLLESHDLESVITQVGNLRKHVCAEFLESSHLLLFSCHTDMALIDERMRSLARLCILPLVFFERIPYLGAECLCDRVLDGSCHVCRKSFGTAALPLYVKLVENTMLEEHRRKHDLPVSSAERSQGVCLSPLPVVELSYQIDLCRIRSPLTEHPVATAVAVESVVDMVVHALAQ